MGRSVSRRADLLSDSTIGYFSQLAEKYNAINLAEGIPDFPAPQPFKDAAIAAIKADMNQYRHVQDLCDKVAAAFEARQVVDHGDEVVLLDPSYETYESSVLLAGGKPKHVGLTPPFWTLDLQKLKSAMGPQTKAVIVNSPHNPTGKVFSGDELAGIAELCCKFDCFAVTDEVYEHIFFTGTKHRSLASLPGMQERTVVTSSISKTFTVTGWRIGWAIAPEDVCSAIGKIHVKLTDSAPAPFQEAAVVALGSSVEYYATLREEYVKRRDFVCEMLQEAGFKVQFKPEGSFFVFALLPETTHLKDVEYVAELIRTAGVAICPGVGFFHESDAAHKDYKNRFVRVAFCKDMTTLFSARQAMQNHSACLQRLRETRAIIAQGPESLSPKLQVNEEALPDLSEDHWPGPGE